MKKLNRLYLLIFFLGFFICCDNAGQEVRQFNTVKIGNQIWMTENLNVDKFRNSDPIPHAKTDAEWCKAGEEGKPAWCYYDNDPANGSKYGKLYNWYAVNDPRGLAPEGWKIPSDEDWERLKEFLGDVAGKKMKSTSGWEEDGGESGNGTNESGFSGLPGGYRQCYSTSYPFSYLGIGEIGHWWLSPENTDYAWYRGLSNDYDGDFGTNSSKEVGFSVRCLKETNNYTSDVEDTTLYTNPVIKNKNISKPPLSYLLEYKDKYEFEGELFDNEPLKSRLKKILGSNYDYIMRCCNVQSPIKIENGVVFIEGCQKHNCPGVFYVVYIDINSDQLFVGLYDEGTVSLYPEGNTTYPNWLLNWKNQKQGY